MNEVRGDLWKLAAAYDAVGITTNGVVKANGTCVMGRGCALEAKTRFPGLALKLGRCIRQYGNRCFKLVEAREGYTLVSFPVKHRWDEAADLALIERSARQLVEMADKFGWSSVLLPRPGCGNGRLKWDDVRELLYPVLDDRFSIVTFR